MKELTLTTMKMKTSWALKIGILLVQIVLNFEQISIFF